MWLSEISHGPFGDVLFPEKVCVLRLVNVLNGSFSYTNIVVASIVVPWASPIMKIFRLATEPD